jgi:hypothetical protein
VKICASCAVMPARFVLHVSNPAPRYCPECLPTAVADAIAADYAGLGLDVVGVSLVRS